jgi:serine phosphatase RsbU (regulator of sigma subunit)
MSVESPSAASILSWGFAAAALGGDESGDLHVVAPFVGGAVVAVIDGLGHGHEAALAAEAAAAVLRTHAGSPVDTLVRRCHEALHKTRGAALTLASIDARRSTLAWCGIGNVEGALMRARLAPGRSHEAAPTRGGVVGYRLPSLKVDELPLEPGDLLLLASDGIRSGFTRQLELERDPRELAEMIFARDAKTTDDALILAARYLGGAP